MVALVRELTTSEVEDVIAQANKIDERNAENSKSDSASANSGNKTGSGSGSGNKTTSGSSYAKSGEKSISSAGLSTGPAKDKTDSSTENGVENLNLVVEEILSRGPLAFVKEVPEPSAVQNFLESTGTRITVTEASGLENLLRRALTFLPEQKLGPSEPAKHHWYVDNEMSLEYTINESVAITK